VDRPEQLLEHSDVVVVASGQREFAPLLGKLAAGKSIIDLVGIWNAGDAADHARREAYDGVAW
jgi:hypothetical protein